MRIEKEMLESMKRDRLNCQMFICNGIAVDYYKCGDIPTVEKLRSNWNAPKYKDLTDDSIRRMLNLLKKYYQ